MSTASHSLSARRAALRRRRTRRWIAALACVLILAVIAGIAWFSPLLALRSVSVSGAKLTPAAEVKKSVLEQHRGTPLPQIRTGALARQLHDEFPKTDHVKVRWAGPRTLHVTIEDRKPVLTLPSRGAWQRYDSSGALIDTVGTKPKATAEFDPHLTGGVADRSAIRAVASMLAQLPPDAQPHVQKAGAASQRDVRIVYRQADDDATGKQSGKQEDKRQAAQPKDVEIRFGDDADIGKKFDVARTLFGEARGYIDVSVPDAPTTGR